MHGSTISRFFVEKGYKWRGPQIVYRNNEQDQENRLEFCIKNKERNWSDVLITDEASFYFYYQENMDGLHQVIHSREQKQSTPKKFMFGSIQL